MVTGPAFVVSKLGAPGAAARFLDPELVYTQRHVPSEGAGPGDLAHALAVQPDRGSPRPHPHYLVDGLIRDARTRQSYAHGR